MSCLSHMDAPARAIKKLLSAKQQLVQKSQYPSKGLVLIQLFRTRKQALTSGSHNGLLNLSISVHYFYMVVISSLELPKVPFPPKCCLTNSRPPLFRNILFLSFTDFFPRNGLLSQFTGGAKNPIGMSRISSESQGFCYKDKH
jgi:hypothetical protein